ncbi:MAG TPA: hypothetical protein VHK91_07165, partial [Flavisolibacter sp.]|nr:hypothetical protein [Flavisolibacter sp.]
MWKLLICIVFVIRSGALFGQTDTLPPIASDTAVKVPVRTPVPVRRPAPVADTLQQDSVFSATNTHLPPLADSNWKQPGYSWTHHPYFRFTNPTRLPVSIRQWQGKEAIFYALIALLLFFAVIKNSFYRYLQDLINVFFRNTMR